MGKSGKHWEGQPRPLNSSFVNCLEPANVGYRLRNVSVVYRLLATRQWHATVNQTDVIGNERVLFVCSQELGWS